MATASMPLQYGRLYKGALDPSEVHESMEAALEYAKSPIAYPGQKISVKSEDGNKYNVYVINEDGTLRETSTNEELIAALSWQEIPEQVL